MTIPGFAAAEVAWEFARRLQTTAQLAALNANMGIDVGDNQTTLQFSDEVREAMEKAGGLAVRTPVRGIDVYVPGTVSFVAVEATGSSSMRPTTLFEAMERAFNGPMTGMSPRLGLALRMRAEANLLAEPIAKFVVAIAAVEALTQEGEWAPEQRAALDKFADDASRLEIPDFERQELVRRLQSLRQLGVVESMRRLVSGLGLSDVWPRWRAVYDLRSRMLHGSMHPNKITADLDEGLALSRQIVLRAVEKAYS